MASTNARSLTKAITWRGMSVAVTTCFVWLVTGSISFAMYVMAFDLTFMTGLYYAHERLWKAVKWGKFPTKWENYGWHKDKDCEEVWSQWARDAGWKEPR